MRMESRPLACTVLDDGTIRLTVAGDLDEGRLPVLKDEIRQAQAFIKAEAAKQGRKLRALVDLSAFTGAYVPDALTAFAAFERDNAPYVERTAGFGGAERQRFAADIVTALSVRDNISFFETEAEARAWLAAG
jgi:hypothetical protein